jgi:opacity protein-like surface antigen
MKKVLGLAVLACAVGFVPAHAEIAKGNSEVGVNYGSTSYDSKADLDSSSQMALRGGYFLTNLFQVEGQFANADTNSKANTDDKVSTDLMMVNGVFNFMNKKSITPYALVGLGQAKVDVNPAIGSSQSDSATAYQIGAGTRFFFGKEKRAAFRVDVARITEDKLFNSSDKTTNTNISGGFSWKFGGK